MKKSKKRIPTYQEQPPAGSALHMPLSSPSDTYNIIQMTGESVENTNIWTSNVNDRFPIIFINLPFSLHRRYVKDEVSAIDSRS